METEQVLVLLRGRGDLDDGDGEAVGGCSEDGGGQRHVVFIQELWGQEDRSGGRTASPFFVQRGSACQNKFENGKNRHLLERTASSQSHRTCWCRWWCCSQWSEYSCKAQRSQSPVIQTTVSSPPSSPSWLTEAEHLQCYKMSPSCNLLGINPRGWLTFLMQNLLRLSLCLKIVILFGMAAQIHSPLSICEGMGGKEDQKRLHSSSTQLQWL